VHRDIDGRQPYLEMKQRWLRQLDKEDCEITVLKRAANWFSLEEPDIAEDLFLKAQAREPANQEWPYSLSRLYKLHGGKYKPLALAAFKKALELGTDSLPATDRTDLPRLTFAVGNHEDAKREAQSLLNAIYMNDPMRGEVIQSAHTTLGLVALHSGDMDQAVHHLMESIVDAPTPRTISYGPDRELAAELFHAGGKDAVLTWMDRCEDFWTSGKTQLKHWREVISSGDSPFEYLLPEKRQFFELTREPRRAFNRGDFALAKSYANDLLATAEHHTEDERHYGYGVHVAHVVLGQTALKANDVRAAIDHLRKAASIPHSIRLQEHGADLSLAAELILLHQTDSLPDFFESIKSYWKNDWDEPGTWSAKVLAKESHPDLWW
jgi:tetratricopeptide (TPR) repeat protein